MSDIDFSMNIYKQNQLHINGNVRWWPGIVVSVLASTNEVNQRWARLVLRWVTISRFDSWCETFILVCEIM